jgi:hypothetical protein
MGERPVQAGGEDIWECVAYMHGLSGRSYMWSVVRSETCQIILCIYSVGNELSPNSFKKTSNKRKFEF